MLAARRFSSPMVLAALTLVFSSCGGSQIRSPQADLSIEIRTADRRDSYQIGEQIEFEFRASQDCHVTLVDIGSSGRVAVLFPNRWHQDNRVQAGRVYRVPPPGAEYVMDVGGPPGQELVKAFATLDLHDFSERFEEAGEFYRYQGNRDDLQERDIRPVQDSRPRERWAEDTLVLQILPPPPR